MTDSNGERRERLSSAEAADLGAVLSTLVQSGYPLEAGLEAASRELPRGKLARSLMAVARQMRQGRTLDEAIAAQGRNLPEHVRALVAAGLRTVRLGQVLEELVTIQRRTADIHRAVTASLAYPAVLLMTMAAVFSLFSLAVMPGLSRVFEDFHVELPLPTRLLIGMSHSGLWVLAANLTVVVGGLLMAWLSSEVAEIRSMMHAVPLLGPISRWAGLAQLSRLMALLVESDLPLPTALKLAGRGSQDADLAVACRAASRRVEVGQALGQALAGLPQFPKSLGPIVEWGEKANALPDAFRTAAEMFDGRVKAQLGLVRKLVPPLVFLAVLWAILFLLAAIMIPMMGLLNLIM